MENGKLPVGLHCSNIVVVVVVVVVVDLGKNGVGVVKIGVGGLGVYIVVDWVSNAFGRGGPLLQVGCGGVGRGGFGCCWVLAGLEGGLVVRAEQALLFQHMQVCPKDFHAGEKKKG